MRKSVVWLTLRCRRRHEPRTEVGQDFLNCPAAIQTPQGARLFREHHRMLYTCRSEVSESGTASMFLQHDCIGACSIRRRGLKQQQTSRFHIHFERRDASPVSRCPGKLTAIS